MSLAMDTRQCVIFGPAQRELPQQEFLALAEYLASIYRQPSAGVVSWVRVLVAISAEKSTPSRTTVGRVAMLMDQLRVYLPAIQLHKTASSTPLRESASRAGTDKNVADGKSRSCQGTFNEPLVLRSSRCLQPQPPNGRTQPDLL